MKNVTGNQITLAIVAAMAVITAYMAYNNYSEFKESMACITVVYEKDKTVYAHDVQVYCEANRAKWKAEHEARDKEFTAEGVDQIREKLDESR